MTVLFRSAAVERLGGPDDLDEPIRVTSLPLWLVLGVLLAFVAAAATAGLWIVVPITVHGDGIVISAAGVLDVPFPAAGRVAAIAVEAGTAVTRGAVVASLDQPELRRALAQARAEEDDARERRRRVAEFQARSLAAESDMTAERRREVEQSLALLRQRLGYLQERAAIEDRLFAARATTRQKQVDARIDVGKAEEDIAAQRHRLMQIDLDAATARIRNERERLDLDLAVSVAERRRAALEERLSQAVEVVTPHSGTVVELKRNPGEFVREGEALLSLLPLAASRAEGGSAGGLGVTLFVSGGEGKKITPGMTVEVSPSTVPREEYGFMLGRVRAVAALPATEEGMMRTLKNRQLVAALSSGGAPFQVDVDLEPDPAAASGYRWSASRGPAITITPGMLASGRIRVRRLPLAEVVFPALRRLTGGAP